MTFDELNQTVENLIQSFRRHKHRGQAIDQTESLTTAASSVVATNPVGLLVTRDLSLAAGAVTIAHGLGRIPTFIRATGITVAGSAEGLSSFGTFDGTNHTCIYYSKNGSFLQANRDNTFAIAFIPVGAVDYQIAMLAVDATNVTFTWSKSGSPSGNAYIILEIT